MFGSRYLALQLNHAPLQVEQRYMEMYPPDQFWDQRIMNAMSTFCEPRNPFAFAILCQREASSCKQETCWLEQSRFGF